MERNKPEVDATVAQTDDGADDGTVDHQRLAQLVARAEPVMSLPTTEHSLSAPRSAVVKIVAGLVILVGCGIVIYVMTRSSSAPMNAPIANNGAGNNQGGNNPPNTVTNPEMFAVPGGTFQMGRSGGPVQEGPPHAVTVASFVMDNTEVTNAEYSDFVRKTGYAAPRDWGGNSPIGGQEQMPVVNVSLDDANAFAAWRSKRDGVTYRLPTEEEWEYAARGGDQDYVFPWGNSWIGGRAAIKDEGLSSPKPVGSYPDGKARWGHLDMIGNVWEWTSSRASYYSGSELDLLPVHKTWEVIRGGSLASDPQGEKAITNAYRDWIEPTTKNDLLGFRLVRDSK